MSILIAALVCALAATTSSSEIADDKRSYRLPNSTVPKHYDIELWTNGYEGNLSYRGLVEISVDVIEPTHKVMLHAGILTIKYCKIFPTGKDGNREELGGLKVESIIEYEQLEISSNDLFETGSYTLKMEFNGTLNDDFSEGLFLKSYKHENDSEKIILASHFEPIQARRTFPCFDEPGLKATFNLTIVHHKNHEAYSNMPLSRKEVVDENFVKSSFQQTPMMSTYLLIICTTDLQVEMVGNQFALVRNSIDERVGDSLRISQDTLDFMDKYMGSPYFDYVPRLGHLAIALDGNFNAMENWGLILYREEYFTEQSRYHDLFVTDLQLYATEVIVHEVVHQWFGNMVTPEWWSHLWLKEGFATFYQYYILEQIRPNERWMDRFFVDRISLGLNDYNGAKPISSECNNNFNIYRQYNQWSYEKAAGVLNMFRNVVGDDKWQKAIQNYWKNRLLSSATPDDLYSAIEEVSKESEIFPSTHSIQEIFDSWITSAGAVVLNVKRLQGSNKIILEQIRGKYCTESGHQTRIIPFSYAYESAPNWNETGPIHWLTSKVAQITTNASYDEWIIFNKRYFGAYRINYDTHNWQLIIRALHKNVSSIHYLNRVQLLRDALNNYEDRRLDIEILLELITYLRNEADHLVWSTAKLILDRLHSIALHTRKNIQLFKTFQTHLIERVYESFQSQTTLLPITRPIYQWITNMACLGGIRHCLEATRKAFSEAAAGTENSAIAPEQMYTVYCFGMKNSTDEEFGWLLDRLKTSHDRKEQDVILSVLLVCTETIDRMRSALIKIRDLSTEDTYQLWKYVRNADFRVVEDKFQQIFEILGEESEFMKNLGLFFTNHLILLMERLLLTEEESSQFELLVTKFNEVFEGHEQLFPESMNAPMPSYRSFALEDFLQKYVSKLK